MKPKRLRASESKALTDEAKMEIKTVEDLAEAFKQGKYTSIGCYPLFFLCSDGECLSYEAVKENYALIAAAIKDNSKYTSTLVWKIVACDVNWENPDMYCAHTGERIESAYAEPEIVG